MVKKDKGLILLIMFIMLVLVLKNGFQPMTQAWVGIGTEYEIQTEDYNVFLKSSDKYWQKTGCEPVGCPGKNACSVTSNIIDYKLDCPIEECTCAGYYYCDGSYVSDCQYGAHCGASQCNFRSGFWYGDCCERRGNCVWVNDYDCGGSGGPEYDNYDNCAWAARIEDKQGNIIATFDAHEKYGVDWEKDEFYRDGISHSIGLFSLRQVSDSFGAVQQRGDGSHIYSCKSVVFEVKDSKKIYDVCLGNDGLDSVHCEDIGFENVVEETCQFDTYTCSDGTVLSRELPDCDFPECPPVQPEPDPTEDTNALCMDGLDNDGDSYIDCDDWDCSRNDQVTVCVIPTEDTDVLCQDGLDNDEDGYIDCDDWDCSRNTDVSVCYVPPPPPPPPDTNITTNTTDTNTTDFYDCNIEGCQPGWVCVNDECVKWQPQYEQPKEDEGNIFKDHTLLVIGVAALLLLFIISRTSEG